MIRQIYIWSVVITHFLAYVICMPFVFLIALKQPQDILLSIARFLTRKIFRSMGIHLQLKGLEHLPEKGFVLMSNHQSFLDVLVLMASIPRPIRFLAKKELKKVPVLGLCMKSNGQFFIDRENPRNAIKQLKEVERYVDNGGDLCIFPEGTRSLDGQLLPFKKGSFKIPAKIKSPIVPCLIQGSGMLLKKGSFLPKKGSIVISLGSMIDPGLDTDDPKCLDQRLLEKTQAALHNLL